MKRIPPEEWRRRIKTLPVAVQAEVARIVWWDFFAQRLTGDRWDHLDEYLKFSDKPNISEQEMEKSLVKIGYIPEFAFRRSGMERIKSKKKL